MADSGSTLEQVVLTQLLRLNAKVHGIVAGLSVGSVIFIATNWLVLKGGEVVGPHLALLSQFFIGYEVTLAGSFIGFAYGFLSGFVIGYFIAFLYNRLIDLRENRGGNSP
jgi:hypothetical protein